MEVLMPTGWEYEEFDKIEKDVPVNVTHHEMPAEPKGIKPFTRWLFMSGAGVGAAYGLRKFLSFRRRNR